METSWLDFERPIVELEQRVAELRGAGGEAPPDATDELRTLESRLARLREEVYANLTSWQRVQLARHPRRPYTLDYVKALCTDFIELHGDRTFADDAAIVGGPARFEGRPVMIIGHQKGRTTKEKMTRNFGMPHPEGYRKALRLMKMAEKFGAPVISFVDTPGAFPGIGAEERGQSEAIARNLREMSRLAVPIVVVVIGEGGSGGALAIAVGDRILMLENSIYSVISPEGCASILWKDASRAPEAATAMRITASDLLSFGIIDRVVPEPEGGAHRSPESMAEVVRTELRAALEELLLLPAPVLLEERLQKYLRMGVYDESA